MKKVLIVGAGLFGATLAHNLGAQFDITVVDKRNHIGGNVYTENVNGINVHKYGAHIFRTNDKTIWNYLNSFAEFNNFINSPIAIYHNKAYNLPFNMNTFNQLWGAKTPGVADDIIKSQRVHCDNPKNLEEYALSLVGTDIYNAFIKEYTEKQWGKPCHELPISIMKRIPLRFTYDNNYYSCKYQGVPIGGYTQIIEKMLSNTCVLLNIDGVDYVKTYKDDYDYIIYTGCIDEFYGYRFGKLEYRSLVFKEFCVQLENYQGNAVVNYTDKSHPYTRVIEHKWFENTQSNYTVISKEYPESIGEPYYPIESETNLNLYAKYQELAKQDSIIFAGRLGNYKYTDMEETISNAMILADNIKLNML